MKGITMIIRSKVVSLRTACDRTLRSRSSIYSDIKAGRFPKPIQVGARRIGFLESDIDDWIASRVLSSR